MHDFFLYPIAQFVLLHSFVTKQTVVDVNTKQTVVEVSTKPTVVDVSTTQTVVDVSTNKLSLT